MATDFGAITGEVRLEFITVGRAFGSERTHAQAEKTIEAWSRHGAALQAYGFGEADATELMEAKDALTAAGGGRSDAVLDRRTGVKGLHAGIKTGKSLRTRGRVVATNIRDVLWRSGDAATVQRVDAVLAATRSSGGSAGALSTQLEALGGLYGDTAFAAALAGRGDSALGATLTTHADALRALQASRGDSRGTPTESELVDLLDGVIIRHCRAARRAARAAATETGSPAIATDFELRELYGA